MNSYAPKSYALPCGRGTPDKSAGASVVRPPSIPVPRFAPSSNHRTCRVSGERSNRDGDCRARFTKDAGALSARASGYKVPRLRCTLERGDGSSYGTKSVRNDRKEGMADSQVMELNGRPVRARTADLYR